MDKCLLTEKDKKNLDSWDAISNTIEILYLELADIELEYGRDSSKYKKVYDYLLISLEIEKELEHELDFSYEKYNDAIKYFSREESLCSRIIRKITTSEDYARKKSEYNLSFRINPSTFEEVKKSYAPESVKEKMINELNNIVSIYRKNSLREFYQSMLFQYNNFSNILELIEKDLENASYEERKKILSEKYQCITDHPIAESIFLGNGLLYSSIAKDSNLASNYLNISEQSYIEGQKNSFIENLTTLINTFGKLKTSDNSEKEALILDGEYHFRSGFLELGNDTVWDIYFLTKYKNNINNNDLTICFNNAYSRASKDLDSKIKKEYKK